jgi:outer membrane murein-binding lipoprotein Lpp
VDAVWAAVIPVCVSILGGGLAMAWKLGGLANQVQELDDRMDHVERKIDALGGRASRRWNDPQPSAS